MASSLGKLVENLDKNCCVNTGKFYKGKQLSLLMRKGVYPYEYASSCGRLMMNNSHQRRPSIPSSAAKVYRMMIINMRRKYGKSLT